MPDADYDACPRCGWAISNAAGDCGHCGWNSPDRSVEKDAPVPHLFERDRGAIRMCTCGRPHDAACHDPFRVYEPRGGQSLTDIGAHPCPVPRRTKRDREGTVWACKCGRLYALRNNWNYAGDVWTWELIGGDS